MASKGFQRLVDISSWDRDGNWVTWEFHALPSRADPLIHAQFNVLLNNLNGFDPINSSCENAWGWGSSGVYMAALGYKSLLVNSTSSHSAKF